MQKIAKADKRIITGLLLYILLIIGLMPPFYHSYDMSCWRNWALYIHQHGITNIYHSDANYPPVVLYLLYAYDLIRGSSAAIALHITNIKYFSFLFDLLPVAILFVFGRKRELRKGYHFFLLLNIAYVYNSLVWGQVDSIYTNLSLLAIFIALRYPYAAIACFVLALNTKIQAIIFLPILVLILSLGISNWRKGMNIVLIGALAEVVITLPFILTGHFKEYLGVIYHSVGYWPQVSVNAFNFWHLIIPNITVYLRDDINGFILSYRSIGLVLFFTVSAITLLPLFIKTISIYFHKKLPVRYYELVFLTAGIIPLVFFFFNTEMHTRYFHAALVFLFFYSLSAEKWGLYFLVSLANLLNLEKVLKFKTGLNHNLWIFDHRFIAWLFLGAITWGIFLIYRNYKTKSDFLRMKKGLQKTG